MRIELQDFCKNLVLELRPLSEALEGCVTCVHSYCDEASLKPVLTRLIGCQHRLRALVEKADQQRAYLLIFGPLKSGKSTLMNAISGAYVSEVSSLPAYPCMVYVDNAPEPTYSLTKFNGSRERFETNAELQQQVRNAHEQLAKKIRECDKEGRIFDPKRDLPDTVMRVDIGLPAPNLRDSGATLVDTPGLYGKMKFGYDLLTREFQNNAACALFVVKTDNLFLEQVFDEFKELLGFFSRIFLVVNIDSTKKDIGPDGKLHPSLESSEPGRIIEAFEDLTMSSQLRDAIDEGRLRVYLLDLLEAATLSLHGERFDVVKTETEETTTAEVGPLTVTHGKKGFALFLKDLTEYLDSSDYCTEFMHDSLRHSRQLGKEIGECLEADEVQVLRKLIGELELELEREQAKLRAVGRLEGAAWRETFGSVYETAGGEVAELVEERTGQLSNRLKTHVGEWFESSESLRDLVTSRLDAEVRKTTEEVRRGIIGRVSERLDNRHGGASLSAEQVGDLMTSELPLEGIFSAYAGQLEAQPLEAPGATVETGSIPVKKGFFDWLFFRSRDGIRQKLFGDLEAADKPVPARLKARKLGNAGREYLSAQAVALLDGAFRGRWEVHFTAIIDGYVAHFEAELGTRLGRLREGVLGEIRATENKLERYRKVTASMDDLWSAITRYEDKAGWLHSKYVAERLKARQERNRLAREQFIAPQEGE